MSLKGVLVGELAAKTMELCEAFFDIAILTQHSTDIVPSLSSHLLSLSLVTHVILPALFSEIKVSYPSYIIIFLLLLHPFHIFTVLRGVLLALSHSLK